MTTGVAGFVAQLSKANESLAAGQRTAILACAKVAQETMDKAAPSHAVGGHGIKVNTKLLSTQVASVKWGPPGWVRILNDRTQPHFIAPSGKGRGGSLRKQGSIRGNRRASRMGVSSLLGGTVGAGTQGAIGLKGLGIVRAWAHHPGTPGKHFVEVGKAAAMPLVKTTYQRVGLSEPLKAVFH